MDPIPDAAIDALRSRGLASLPPLAIVLGSGLGAFADEARDATAISYLDIPGFPVPSVEGHAGRLVVGTIEGERVALFQGRGHYYERGDRERDADRDRRVPQARRRDVAAHQRRRRPQARNGGRRRWSRSPITSTFPGRNPLIGHAGADRFVPLTKAYDEALLAALREAARSADVELNEGVYMWFSGPSFETPAEIRAARILGADLVGMSTVPEVILARRAGLRCAAVSVVTNYAAGLAGGDPSHEETQAVAHEAADRFKRLLRGFIRVLSAASAA